MRNSAPLCLVVLACLLSPAHSAEAPQTAAAIIERYYQAIGGHERLRAIRTMRMKGTISFGNGVEATLLVEQKLPNCGRMEFGYQGLTQVIGFNDSLGWKCNPLGGKPAPERLPSDAVESLRRTFTPDGLFATLHNTSSRIVSAEPERISDTPVWKVIAVAQLADTAEFNFDTESGLLVRAVIPVGEGLSRYSMEELLGDYRAVNGIRYPHTIVTHVTGAAVRQVWMIDSIVFDASIPDSRFTLPDSTTVP